MKKFYILIISFFSISLSAKTVDHQITIDQLRCTTLARNIAVLSNSPPGFLNHPLANDPRVKVYPNPTQESFNVEIELDKNSEVEVIVYNAIGKSVFSSKDSAPSGKYIKPIHFEEQPSGIYFVNVKSGEIKSVERLIKIK